MFGFRGALRRATTLGAIAATLAVVAVSALGATGAGADTPTAPAAPIIGVPQPGYHNVELKWTVGADNGDPITSFIIDGYLSGTQTAAFNLPVGSVGSNVDPTPGAQDFFYLAGSQNVTNFSFSVSSVSGAGVGAASDISGEVSSTSFVLIPSPPYNVTATAGTNGITLTWVVAPDNGAPIIGYTIDPFVGSDELAPITVAAGTPGSALSPVAGATDSTTIKGLTTGTTYTFTMGATADTSGGLSSRASNPVTDIEPAAAVLTASVSALNFGDMTLGDITDDKTVTFTNTGNSPAVITDFDLEGVGFNDYVETADTECDDPTTLAPGASCTETIAFLPGALGSRPATLSPIDGVSGNPVVTLNGTGSEGYYEVSASGHVDTFGDAVFQDDLTGQSLPAPIIGLVSTGGNTGYWLFDGLGNVYSFGDASDSGDLGNDRLSKPIVGMAATPDEGGYWLVAADGGVFAFGDARFFGSTGTLHLNKPIVGMAATPDGFGYWLVASDGGIFAFGDAPFLGSTGSLKLNRPIVGMAATADGHGYWLDASDGGIFAFGDAPFYGSDGGKGITNSAGIALDGYATTQATFDFPADRIKAHVKR